MISRSTKSRPWTGYKAALPCNMAYPDSLICVVFPPVFPAMRRAWAPGVFSVSVISFPPGDGLVDIDAQPAHHPTFRSLSFNSPPPKSGGRCIHVSPFESRVNFWEPVLHAQSMTCTTRRGESL